MLTKMVNGVEVICSPEEEAIIRAEWAKPLRPVLDLGDIDVLEKTFKALALVMRDYCNQLLAGTYTQRTVPQLRADFKLKFDSLP